MQFATQPGVRLIAGEIDPCGVGWEVGYLGVWGMFADATAQGPANISVPDPLATLVPSLSNASVARTTYASTLNSAELNIFSHSFDGGYSRVTDFIRAWREQEGQTAVANAFIPLAFELGEAYQFDWSEEGLVVGGIYYRAQVSHMKLCASRAFWLVAYPSQGHEMLFDAHTRSFAALGGIARRGSMPVKSPDGPRDPRL
jgi:hypothetical protein